MTNAAIILYADEARPTDSRLGRESRVLGVLDEAGVAPVFAACGSAPQSGVTSATHESVVPLLSGTLTAEALRDVVQPKLDPASNLILLTDFLPVLRTAFLRRLLTSHIDAAADLTLVAGGHEAERQPSRSIMCVSAALLETIASGLTPAQTLALSLHAMLNLHASIPMRILTIPAHPCAFLPTASGSTSTSEYSRMQYQPLCEAEALEDGRTVRYYSFASSSAGEGGQD